MKNFLYDFGNIAMAVVCVVAAGMGALALFSSDIPAPILAGGAMLAVIGGATLIVK